MERLTKRVGDEVHELAWSGEILHRLAEYEDTEEAGLIKRLPCKEGAPIYYIRKQCQKDPEYKYIKNFKENCEHYSPEFYEKPEHCLFVSDVDNRYSEYCSLNLSIFCDKCKGRLTICKDYFTLSYINRIYNTAQFDIKTLLENIFFLTVEEAQEKIEELKNERV